MSLTAELRNPASPVRRFFEARLPDVAVVQDAWSSRMAGARVLRRRPRAAAYPAATVGQAVDYRIRFAVAYGRAAEGMLAFGGAQLLTRRLRPAASAAAGGPAGGGPGDSGFLVDVGAGAAWDELLARFLGDLDVLLSALGPASPMLDDAAEDRLCAACYVLALLESLWRSGGGDWPSSPLRAVAPTASVDDLVGLAGPIVVEDLRALTALFVERGLGLLGSPVVPNPTFAGSPDVFGADADLIAGDLLVDLKTVARADVLAPEWIYQLAGYVLLDYDDEYAIASVAVYLVRHGELVVWPVDELLTTLSGGTADRHGLRAELRALLADARERRRPGGR